MTDLLPWLAANLQFIGIALAFIIFLIAGLIWALGWYFWRWIAEAHEPTPDAENWRSLVDGIHGDLPHVPEKAKRRAA